MAAALDVAKIRWMAGSPRHERSRRCSSSGEWSSVHRCNPPMKSARCVGLQIATTLLSDRSQKVRETRLLRNACLVKAGKFAVNHSAVRGRVFACEKPLQGRSYNVFKPTA